MNARPTLTLMSLTGSAGLDPAIHRLKQVLILKDARVKPAREWQPSASPYCAAQFPC
jgi:hypothetical protein